ncbi:Endonuclease V [archaeon HR01]|nr:Endonuclease V [archaeon HR01]
MRRYSSSTYSLEGFLKLLSKVQEAVARIAYPPGESLADIKNVAAVDVAYRDETYFSAAVIYDCIRENLAEKAYETGVAEFPYIPSYLLLREVLPMMAAVQRLGSGWDLLLVDGHGRAHPRMCGLATFLGFMLGRPTLGVAKKLLVGERREYLQGLDEIIYRGERVGFAVGGPGVKTFYVSQGYGVGYGDLIKILNIFKMRYPEPLKIAHAETVRLRRGLVQKG